MTITLNIIELTELEIASTPVKFLGIADSDGSDITGVGIKRAKYQNLQPRKKIILPIRQDFVW